MKMITNLLSILIPASIIQAATLVPVDKEVLFRVLDSEGNPVSGVLIEASRYGPEDAREVTNDNGTATLVLTDGMSLSVYASKEGFYRTGGRLWTGGLYNGGDGRLIHEKLPDEFEIIMKRIINPIDMRHKHYRNYAPVSEDPVGFDLKVGDWILPLGSGKIADLYFHFHDIYVNEESYSGTMTITFPNQADGIQSFKAARAYSMEFGSDLPPPHMAPVEGYNESLICKVSHTMGESYQSYVKKGQNYLFRTRTILDANGRILQACYGWIQGDIKFDPRDPIGPQLDFDYFFNTDPDPDNRSLEYNLHVPIPRPN